MSLLEKLKSKNITTFKCEGCGNRFTEDKLYIKEKDRISLENGDFYTKIFINGRKRLAIIKLVCSEACYNKAPIKTLTELGKLLNLTGTQMSSMTHWTSLARNKRAGYYNFNLIGTTKRNKNGSKIHTK